MNPLEDEATQEAVLLQYRAGGSQQDAALVAGMGVTKFRRLVKTMPEFALEIDQAKREAFEPAFKRALKLAEQLDVDGERKGSLKAMELVFKYYGNIMEHDHQKAVVLMKGQLKKETEDNRPAPPVLLTPEAAAAYARAQRAVELNEGDTA